MDRVQDEVVPDAVETAPCDGCPSTVPIPKPGQSPRMYSVSHTSGCSVLSRSSESEGASESLISVPEHLDVPGKFLLFSRLLMCAKITLFSKIFRN